MHSADSNLNDFSVKNAILYHTIAKRKIGGFTHKCSSYEQ